MSAQYTYRYLLKGASTINGVQVTELLKVDVPCSVKRGLTLSQTTNFRLFQTESLPMTISNLLKMAESSPNRLKTLWEKEKLLLFPVFLKDLYC